MARVLGRGVAVVILASATVCVFAPAASAHAVLIRSDPPAGMTLSVAPEAVHLWFSEQVSHALSSARLIDGDGREVDGARLTTGSDLRSLDLTLPPLRRGSYGVLWHVFDEDDGHTTSGVLVFHVGEASGSAAFEDAGIGPTDSPLDVVLHWLAFCALAGLVGAVGVAGFVVGGAERRGSAPPLRAAERRLTLLGATSAAAGTLVGIMIVIAEARRVAPPGSGGSSLGTLTTLLGTRWGSLWLVRECALVAAGVFLLIRFTRSPAKAAAPGLLWAAGGSAIVVVVTLALGSHAAGLDAGRGMAVVADGVHLLTACLWLGSVPALLLVLWPSHPGVERGDLVRECRTPFSWLAGTSVCLVAATGLYSAGRQVERVDSLASTAYGRTLLVKILIVGAVGALGLLNALRFRGRRVGSPTGRTTRGRRPTLTLIAVESSLGIALLLVASILIGNPPARGPGLAASVASSSRTVYGSVGDLVVSVTVSPNRPGVNGFTYEVASSRRPPPAPVDDVALELQRGDRIAVVTGGEVETGTYFGTGTFDVAGRWKLTAFVRRGDRTSIARLHLTVPATAAASSSSGGGSRLAPITDVLTLLVLGGGVVIAVTVRRRARRSRSDRGAAPVAQTALPRGDGSTAASVRERDDMPALSGSREGP